MGGVNSLNWVVLIYTIQQKYWIGNLKNSQRLQAMKGGNEKEEMIWISKDDNEKQ